MIKLTVNPESQRITRIFHKKTVIIGMGEPDQVDISLPEESLQAAHVKIIEDKGRYYAINIANDPFLELNGLPFGKKALNNHDRILIGNTIISFEEHKTTVTEDMLVTIDQPTSVIPPPIKTTVSRVTAPVKAKETPLVSPTEPDSREVEEKKENEENEEKKEEKRDELDVDALIHEVEALEEEASQLEAEVQVDDEEETTEILETEEAPKLKEETETDQKEEEIPTPTQDETQKQEKNEEAKPEQFQVKPKLSNDLPAAHPHPKASLEDYYLNEFDDESENWNVSQTTKETKNNHNKRRWKTFTGVLIVLIFLSTGFAGGYFFDLRSASSTEESIIAGSVADIAIALTYAQINHITPRKLNWSDPDFIQNNLSRILSPKLNSLVNIDAQGQFKDYPYMLRIYTSSDLSQFLIIAQPAPGIFNWLTHKNALVIDSTSMEIRKLSNLKTLNRLLANPNPLDDSNSIEIANAVNHGMLIPLPSLISDKSNWGFAPPKALALIRPGAENYIYNSPRYYPFSESIMKRAIYLKNHSGSSYDVALLQQEMDEISKLTDIILYSSQGMQMASEAQKALATFAPQTNFMVAYLKLNAKGYVTSSHLLMDNEHSDNAFSSFTSLLRKSPTSDELWIAESDTTLPSEDGSYELTSFPPTMCDNCVDPNHPLYLQLTALATARQRALKPISDEMLSLINAHTLSIVDDFQELFQELVQEYQAVDKQQEEKLVKSVYQLYQDYSGITLEQFMIYLNAAGLEPFVHRAQNTMRDGVHGEPLSRDQFDKLIAKIKGSKVLDELDTHTEETAKKLTLEQLPDPDRLIQYQNMMHIIAVEKLVELLFDPQPEKQIVYNQDDRATLIHILRTAWVTDSYEYDYFVNELDIIITTDEN